MSTILDTLVTQLGLDVSGFKSSTAEAMRASVRMQAAIKRDFDEVAKSTVRMEREFAVASSAAGRAQAVTQAELRLKGEALRKEIDAQARANLGLKETQEEVSRSGGVLGDMMGSLRAQILGAAAAYLSLQSAKAFFGSLITANIEDERTIARLSQTLRQFNIDAKKAIPIVNELGDAFLETTGIADELSKRGFEKLLRVGAPVGSIFEDLAVFADVAAGSIELAGDKNARFLEVVDAMAKVLSTGTTRGLIPFNIKIKEGLTPLEAYTQALAQMRAQFSGQAIADLQTAAAKTATLSEKWGELLEGMNVKPAMHAVLDFLIEGTTRGEQFVNILSDIFDFLPLGTDLPQSGPRTDWFQMDSSTSEDLAKAQRELAGFKRQLEEWPDHPQLIAYVSELEQRVSSLTSKLEYENKQLQMTLSGDVMGPFLDVEGPPLPPPPLNDETLTKTIQIYESVISSGKATATELLSIWKTYGTLRSDQMERGLAELASVTEEEKNILRRVTEEAANEQLADLMRAPVDKAVEFYRGLVSSQELSEEELENLWAKYTSIRLVQIDAEAQKYRTLGKSAVETYREIARANLQREGIERQRTVIDQQISQFDKILRSQALSQSQFDEVWTRSSEARISKLQLEGHNWLELGLDIETIIALLDQLERDNVKIKIDLETLPARTKVTAIDQLIRSESITAEQITKLQVETRAETKQILDARVEDYRQYGEIVVGIARQIFEKEEELRVRSIVNRPRDQRIAAYEDILRTTILTRDQVEETWSDLAPLKLDFFADVERDLMDLGLSSDQAAVRVAQLKKEFNDLHDDAARRARDVETWGHTWSEWLEDLTIQSRQTAEAMAGVFEDNFFKTMEGEFIHFSDFVKSVVNDITEYLEQQLSKELAQRLTKGVSDILSGEPAPPVGAQEDAQASAATAAAVVAESSAASAASAAYALELASKQGAISPEFIAITNQQAAANLEELASVGALTASYFALAAAKTAAGAGNAGSESGSAVAAWAGDKDILPVYGDGGLVTSPQVAVVGDVPEIIVPLKELHNEQWFEKQGVSWPGLDTTIPQLDRSLLDDVRSVSERDEKLSKIAESIRTDRSNRFSEFDQRSSVMRDFTDTISRTSQIETLHQSIADDNDRIAQVGLGVTDDPEEMAKALGLPAYAEGGLVQSAQLALIGEAGPEVVVPVDRLNDQGFWLGLGLDRRDDREYHNPPPVNITIVTQDAPSFKASESQIMTRIGTLMGRRMRRNT